MDSHKDYRDMQTKFVSHLSGSTLHEVLLLIVIIPGLSVLVRNLFALLLATHNVAILVMIDFIWFILPLLLALTFLSKCLIELCLLLTIISGVLMIGLLIKISSRMKTKRLVINYILDEYLYSPFKGEHTHITSLRAYTLICSCICILAVDFIIFPRRFAKTETFGVSFMDIGVGAFIIANAIVSPEGQHKTDELTILDKVRNIIHVLKGSSPILLLGIARLVAVKSLNYQEHVTEYGLHWNFFITLFFVKILSSIILSIIPYNNCCIFLAPVISFFYEFRLSNGGLMAYILSDVPRDSFVHANREGLFSLFGYVSLYIYGIETGRILFTKANRLKIIGMTSSMQVVSITIGSFLYYSGFQVSRRLANFSYVALCLFIACLALQAFMFADFFKYMFQTLLRSIQKPHVGTKPHSNHKWKRKKKNGNVNGQGEEVTNLEYKDDFNLLRAVNDNGLAYFLLANLLTGLVNISMETVRAPKMTGFFVVLVYTIVLCTIFSVMQILRIRFKFW